ncbi:hydantoinase B/oxoprolinase family protein [Spirillospora sp. CA-294931]|uniref:hydantoinase B/oxoprolinase family protein n=1 Tax=Spirillospora sp. CA-294931 TaxID=3240042 RepID=UPI003D8C2784
MRLRIGIDTGGTFTDVVAVDEDTGEIITTKTPSTPDDPAVGFLDGLARVAGDADVAGLAHGTTVATNRLLEDRLDDLGLVTTEGFGSILEIARQSVPDGYGNSYFWVKPPRLVPAHRVRTVGGRLDHTGAEIRPFDEDGAVAAARWFRAEGVRAIGVCFLHAYADPSHELAMREVLRREHPEAVVSLSSEVLREYREYERAVTTLVDAAVKPAMSRYLGRIGRPLHVMKSNGGVLSAAEVVHQPITTVLSGPAAGALGAAFVASHTGHGSVVTLDGGGTSTDVAVVLDGEPTLTTEGSIGRHPVKIPMIDIVTVGAGGGSVAWVSPEGTLKVGPRSAGADPGPLCYGRGGAEVTVTDAHAVLGRIPPHLLGGRIPLDVGAARAGLAALAGELGLSVERAATGILEISAWNQANAIRQITVKRGLDVRDYPMVAFGGSGPLLACRLLDVLGLPSAVIPVNPGNLSAFGLLTVDVKNDYVRTRVERDAELDLSGVADVLSDLEHEASAALEREGFAPPDRRFDRSADLRYYGQASEVRVPAPGGPVDETFRAEVVRRFHDAHERLYGYCYRDDERYPVEWVNLRVSGIGPITRPRLPELPKSNGDPRPSGTRRVLFDEWAETPVYRREDLTAGHVIHGPAVIEEFGSTLPLHPGFTTTVDPHGNLVITPNGHQGERAEAPDLQVSVIEGTLASVEREVETAIARTARSPMIRDAHDFRAGIHDRRLRKLTGRSYSALVHPIARDFPLETMRPGDVFFHNDVYLSEGGIGHLPDLCVTVPVFHQGEVVAFVQAFGHHDDIGGAVPGSMPSHARSAFEEGLMVPPIKLWDAGVPNEAALRIMTRNSRMPDSLAGDLDAECSACLMGARRLGELFERYGRAPVEACFDAIIDKTTRTFRRELLSTIPDGTYVWEDYAEHDGVDPPRLHTQRITLTVDNAADVPLVIDFTGTSPQAKGPINHAGDYAGGVFLKKWLAPVLRNLADTPERAAELDVNEGVVPLIEMRFPEKGTLLTPIFPAPTNARTFVILRLLGVLAGVLAKATGGRMPADQETIRYTGVYGDDDRGPYLMREVLGGGSGGRPYADGEDTIHIVPDSRNIPAEFAEARWPFVVERLGLAVDSGGPGEYRGGLGYDKHIRMLRDAHYMSIADRSILACWGVNGGRAGRPFRVEVDGREMEGLVDDHPVRAGQVIRIRTTGGGGWGDPLDRAPSLVRDDVRDGKVSPEGARNDYGVVLVGADVDEPATTALRERLRTERGPSPFFDRGPGYPLLSGGQTTADVDEPGPQSSAGTPPTT